jgi:4-amino-4-deoxy-L-arabinose transferase-like glycosyltransferase
LRNASDRRSTAFGLAACLFFFAAGLALIPRIGIEGDEALFAQALYEPRYERFSITIGGQPAPLMVMSYVGALKAWLYRPIVQVFGPSLSTLRVPMLLAGVASIWLFFLLLRRVAGNRAAVIGSALLATDATYLATTCFDWGPVALQHLLLLAGMLWLAVFSENRRPVFLGAAFFVFGVAVWDKALAVWMLSGLAAGLIAVFPRRVIAMCTPRRLATAVVCFALGALPLLIFNVASPLATLRENVRPAAVGISGKLRVLAATAGGPGLFGYLNGENANTPAPHPPHGWSERMSARIANVAGPRNAPLLAAFLLALAVAPLAGGAAIRAIGFAMVAMTVAWFEMALLSNAGGGVHHTILLWPLPEFVVAVALAGASRRFGRAGLAAAGMVVGVAVLWGALVVNHYHALMVRNGGGPGWNLATVELAGYLKRLPAKSVLCVDWGILDPLRFLGGGKLRLGFGDEEAAKPTLTAEDEARVRRMISEPGNVFVAHTPEFAVFPGRVSRLIDYAGTAGFRRELLAIISDGYGRRVFEVFRFVRNEGRLRPVKTWNGGSGNREDGGGVESGHSVEPAHRFEPGNRAVGPDRQGRRPAALQTLGSSEGPRSGVPSMIQLSTPEERVPMALQLKSEGWKAIKLRAAYTNGFAILENPPLVDTLS